MSVVHHARASRQPPPHPDQVLFRDGRLVSVVHDGRPRSHAVLEVVQAHLAFYLGNHFRFDNAPYLENTEWEYRCRFSSSHVDLYL